MLRTGIETWIPWYGSGYYSDWVSIGEELVGGEHGHWIWFCLSGFAGFNLLEMSFSEFEIFFVWIDLVLWGFRI